jgi:hypothetical protein
MNLASSTNDKAMDNAAAFATSTTLQQIHYAALPPDKNVTTAHVHQILGIRNHSNNDIAITVGKLAKMKHDLCSWVGMQIKSKMAEAACAVGDEQFPAKANDNNNPINSFAELKQWWMQPHIQEHALCRNSFYCIAYVILKKI